MSTVYMGPKLALITWHIQYNLCSMFLIWEPNMNNSAYLELLGIWKPEQQSINIQSRHHPPSPSLRLPPLTPPTLYFPPSYELSKILVAPEFPEEVFMNIGLKSAFMTGRLFTNVLAQWLKRYIFSFYHR
jgi:hypothetical protein